jgi:hypothetical protein
MAWAYHHHGKWFACWKDGRGKWRRTATLARTKTDAKRLAIELEAKGERQRKGLEPLPDEDGGGTVAELLSWWLAGRVRRLASKAAIETMTRAHLLTSEFADAPLASLTPGEIETFLTKKGAEPPAGAGLAPQTVNHLRGFLYRAFEQAKKVGRYTGTNPVASVPKVKVPKRTPDYLRHEEVEPVLAALLERGSASVACGWGHKGHVGTSMNGSVIRPPRTRPARSALVETCQHEWGEVLEPSEGPRTRLCARCGKVKNEPTCARHTWGVWTKEVDGRTRRRCELCGKAKVLRCQSAHRWSRWTRHEDDTRTRTCRVCAGPKTFRCPRDHHEWSAWVQGPTQEVRHCLNCGRSQSFRCAENEHRWSDWKQGKNGQDRHCPRCNGEEHRALNLRKKAKPPEVMSRASSPGLDATPTDEPKPESGLHPGTS